MSGRSFGTYVLTRLLYAVGVLLATFTVAFAIIYALPGDPARLILGGATSGSVPTQAEVDAVNAEYGFDRPIWAQYLDYLWNAAHGDLGSSFASGETVTTLLGRSAASTVQLTAAAFAFAVVVGGAVGTWAVYTRSRHLSRVLDAVPAVSVSLPSFWVGLLLIQFLSFRLDLFPASGDVGWRSVVLPAVTLGLAAAATIAQVLNRSLRNEIAQPYVDVARARGASRRRAFFVHAYRNAMVPVLTVSGLVVANLFAYSTISETVFSRAGLGFTLQSAVKSKDIPVILAVVALVAAIYVLANLVVDLLYPLLDPRLAGARRRTRPATTTAAAQ